MTIGIPSLNGQDRIDDAPVEGNEFSDALSQFEEDAGGPHTESIFEDRDTSEEALSLLEENARLRKLVVKLSKLILKYALDDGSLVDKNMGANED